MSSNLQLECHRILLQKPEGYRDYRCHYFTCDEVLYKTQFLLFTHFKVISQRTQRTFSHYRNSKNLI